MLENAVVRAAAVSSLAKFGVCVDDPAVMSSVNVLLRRCLDDLDDEVRDRAAMYIRILEEKQLADALVKEGMSSSRIMVWAKLIKPEATFSLAALESELVSYVNDGGRHEAAFDVSVVPKVSREQAAAEVAAARPSALESMAVAGPSKIAEPTPTPSAAETQSAYASQLSSVPELASYGPVLRSSSKPIALTESETEYVVTLVKHVYREHVVFQFNISNTIPDTVLEEVSVLMALGEEGELVEDFIIPVPSLTANGGAGQVYVSFTRTDPASYASANFGCTLRFVSKEVDPTSGEPEEEGYQDEYQIEDCDLGAGDVSLTYDREVWRAS